MSEGQGSNAIPKEVRGEPLETDAGTQVPAQQPSGPDNLEGGGEFPSPSAPARPPAPGAAAPASGPPPGDYPVQHIPLNMYEADAALVLVAPLPGVMADDVQVTIEGTKVRISAAMRTPAVKDYQLHEWHYGPFEREIEVPDGFHGEPAATFGNGQLALRLPRSDGPPAQHKVVRPSAAP